MHKQMEETNPANENELKIARVQQYQQYEVERLEIDCPSIAATAAIVLKAFTRMEGKSGFVFHVQTESPIITAK